jgi:hypothetical protein
MGNEWALPDLETLLLIRTLPPLSGLADLAGLGTPLDCGNA